LPCQRSTGSGRQKAGNVRVVGVRNGVLHKGEVVGDSMARLWDIESRRHKFSLGKQASLVSVFLPQPVKKIQLQMP